MAEDPLAVLTGLYGSSSGPSSSFPLLVQLKSLPNGAGWRLELSEDNGVSWSSLEPGKPGHPSPGQGIETGAALISSWRASRSNAAQSEVSHFFTAGKLERRKILVPNEDPIKPPLEVDGYAAQAEDGTWVESTTPVEAINKAKARKGIKPATRPPVI